MEYYFKVADSEYELENAYRLRYKVYCEEKRWLKSEDYPGGIEKDEYDDKAVHVIAFDEEFRIVGNMRILQKEDFGKLPFENHPSLAGRKVDVPDMAELSRFVIRTGGDSLMLAKGLLRAIYHTCVKLGIWNCIDICEPSLIRLVSKFNVYFEPLAPPSMYYGGFTQPALLDIREMQEKWKKDEEAWVFYHEENAVLRQLDHAG